MFTLRYESELLCFDLLRLVEAVSLWRLPRRPMFESRPVHVRSVVNKMALGMFPVTSSSQHQLPSSNAP